MTTRRPARGHRAVGAPTMRLPCGERVVRLVTRRFPHRRRLVGATRWALLCGEQTVGVVTGRRPAAERVVTAPTRRLPGARARQRSRDEFGRYVLAADPACSARRTAGKPVTELPSASEAESSLAPAATTHPVPPA